MAWVPPSELGALLQKIIVRAKETALVGFREACGRIENEQASRGVLGGIVAHRCIEAAGAQIRTFGAVAASELLASLKGAGVLSRPSTHWAREALNANIDGLTNGFGAQIDGLKTTGGLKGNTTRLDRYRLESKRDVDIAFSSVEIGLPAPTLPPRRPMYQLLVSGCEHAWNGGPATFKSDRVLLYTDADVKTRFEALDDDSIAALIGLPCVFAYEQPLGKAPLYGRLTHVSPTEQGVKLDYEIVPVSRFLTHEDWASAGSEFGINYRSERFDTHWAVKEVDLRKVLAARGISLPAVSSRPVIDIETHRFDVALSFPGEQRELVNQIAERLELLLGANTVFYDAFFPGELAQPDLDTLLRRIYGERAEVVVVVACADYQRKTWCGLEFRAIKQLIYEREHRKVMIIRTDDGAVDGVFPTDGYLDAAKFDVGDLAAMIARRVHELRSKQRS